MNLTQFKALVDQAVAVKQARRPTDPQPTHFVHYEPEHAHLRELVGRCRLGTDRVKVFADLMHEVAVRCMAFGDALEPYQWISAHLRETFRIEPATNDVETADWAAAIQCVVDNEANSVFAKSAHNLNARPMEIGRAVRTLADAGFVVEVAGPKINVPFEVLKCLQEEFDALAVQIGGAQLAHLVFQSIAPTFNAITKRFHVVRRVDFIGSTMLAPQVPWGYLVQLGMKHMNAEGGPGWRAPFDRLVSLSKASIAVFDIQPYSPYETMFVSHDGIMEYLQDGTTYDAIFTIPQLNPDHAKTMYHGLFTENQKKTLQSSGVRLATAIKLADLILDFAHPKQLVQFTDIGTLASRLGYGKGKTVAIIDAVFAWTEQCPNQELGFPPYSSHMDSMFRPLFKRGHGRYEIPPKSVCALALFEAIMMLARSADASIDSHVGKAIETLLKNEFRKKGVKFKSGSYNFHPTKSSRAKNLESDCDIVVETETRIIFLECKKKSLTRLARSGDQVKILADLSDSLVYSQTQALQHERLLRTEPHFILSDPEHGEVRLELHGRKVERVSVSLLDYDSLQDTSSLQRFLEICCQLGFSHPDASQQKILDAVSFRFAQLKNLAEAVGEFGDSETLPFGGSTFTCVPKVLLVLDHATDSETFWAEMGRTKRVFTGTRDFYADYAYWLGMAAPRAQVSNTLPS